MERIWRWYGPNGPVFLVDVRQAGTTGMVTVLHHIPNSEIRPAGEILKHKAIAEDVGLAWSVVGSVPVHENIKAHIGNYEQWTANYQQTLRGLAQYGIHAVCYNFIPMLNQIRAGPEYVLPSDSKVLRFDQIEFAAFEMYTLKRPGVEADYTEGGIARAVVRLTTMSDEDKAYLTHNIIAGLPGVEEGHTLDQSRKHLELYRDIDRAELRGNLAAFLKAIIPIVKEVGVCMAVHPDDPPRPIPGLPRTASTVEDMRWMVDTANSVANSFTMCTGFYGVCADSDPADMIRQSGLRIYFTHLHSTMREDNLKTFYEVVHLNSDVNMYEVVKVIAEGERHRKVEGKEDLIPMRPDHGHRMLDDLKKKTSPGYPAIGRLKGLAEIRGVELAIQCVFFGRQYPPAWLRAVSVPSSLPLPSEDGFWSLW